MFHKSFKGVSGKFHVILGCLNVSLILTVCFKEVTRFFNGVSTNFQKKQGVSKKFHVVWNSSQKEGLLRFNS